MDEEDCFGKIINMITKLEVGRVSAVNDHLHNSLGKNSEIDFFDALYQKKIKLFIFFF